MLFGGGPGRSPSDRLPCLTSGRQSGLTPVRGPLLRWVSGACPPGNGLPFTRSWRRISGSDAWRRRFAPTPLDAATPLYAITLPNWSRTWPRR